MVTDPHVLVVGAGPTGLALALWLTHQGVRVRIVDKTPEPSTTSRALGVHARTLELYRQIDLADATVAGGVRAAGINFWVKGRRVAHAAVGDMGQGLSPFPFVLIYPQDEHERLLIGRLSAAGITVERQTELIGFDQDSDGVRATLRRADGGEEALRHERTSRRAAMELGRRFVRRLGSTFQAVRTPACSTSPTVLATGVTPGRSEATRVDLGRVLTLLAVFPLPGARDASDFVGTVRDESAAERPG